MTRAELDFAIETFKTYELDFGALLLGDSFLFRLGNCGRLFSEIFDTSTGDPVAMLAGYIIGCASMDSHEHYDWIRAEPADIRDYMWYQHFNSECDDLKPKPAIRQVNEAFEELNEWALEVEAAMGGS